MKKECVLMISDFKADVIHPLRHVGASERAEDTQIHTFNMC